MCFFKKKHPVVDTKFKKEDPVTFIYNGDEYIGWIYKVYPKDNSETIYDCQIGGQCPAVAKGIKEKDIQPRKE